MDGTEFDSLHKRGKPATFAPSQVVKGWYEALQIMGEGAKYQLFLPSELGYGDSQRGAHITPGAVLIFELELLKVEGEPPATARIWTEETLAASEFMTAPAEPPPHVAKGKRVQVIGLESKPEFNDQLGTVTGWDASRGRAGVQLDSGPSFALKPGNLWPVND